MGHLESPLLDPTRREVRERMRMASHLLPPPGGEVVRGLLDVIDRLDLPHMIMFDDDGWSIQHSIACRDDMLSCPVHVAAGWLGEPVAPGRYMITVEGGLPVIGDAVVGIP